MAGIENNSHLGDNDGQVSPFNQYLIPKQNLYISDKPAKANTIDDVAMIDERTKYIVSGYIRMAQVQFGGDVIIAIIYSNYIVITQQLL